MQTPEMDTLEKLKLFREKAEELRQSRLIQKGISLKFSITFDRTKGVLIETEKPDEEDLRSYLLTFRQFILKKGPIYLPRICNLCLQNITDVYLRKRLAEAKEFWNQDRQSYGMGVDIFDHKITPESATYLLINAHYFHSDPDRIALLKRLSSLKIEEEEINFQFRFYLVATTKFIVTVSNIIGIAIEKGLLTQRE